jgi:response regulator RpfG family c-di-GMP phosphodiesterase/serine/threonine protein kinase
MRIDFRQDSQHFREQTIYCDPAASVSHDFIDELLVKSFVHSEDWKRLPKALQERMLACGDRRRILSLMVEHQLLTDYQASRIAAGTTFGLVLGNYRILKRLGAGGMAVVFEAEHIEMRHTVAVKVLPLTSGQDERLQSRFSSEMRIVARLRHPNIVGALDAGRVMSDGSDATVLWYLVMEYVPGLDLEVYVNKQGPLTTIRACNLMYQAAAALDEINKYQLVHRDIKPSNIMVTPEDQAKLLDFGLSRQIDTRVTQPGTLLGTLDFMAPEQARDASTVDIRADIYSLGVTLFWCLTGRIPYSGSVLNGDVFQRFQMPPPSVLRYAPDVPVEMDAFLKKIMALKPEDRFATPQAVMRALLPFLKPDSFELSGTPCLVRPHGVLPALPAESKAAGSGHRILVVDDEVGIRQFCTTVLLGDGRKCDTAPDAETALELAAKNPYDLVLTDVLMPGIDGMELTRRLRQAPTTTHMKVIMFSGTATSDELAKMLSAGADDFLIKPISIATLQGRVFSALRMKDAQDRGDSLNRQLQAVNEELERNVNAKEGDLVHARNALVLALAKLVEHRDGQTGARLTRMQQYCRVLAAEASTTPGLAGQINETFIDMVVCCAPLHDIGKIGLPDHILLKPGKLSSEERIVMQTHTSIGGETLKQVAETHGVAMAFLYMAAEIARHHHERWDGGGYPDRLSGNTIPLAARLVAICDVYDALRCRRAHKPALAHHAALQLMGETCEGQFDPGLFAVFIRCADDFERVFRECPDA